ncbi:hypothetical protein [Kitasatospora sp. NPDC058218]|uniref:hypothetical protein n=1 Tax=Kitasatospora sp. NPDC058218 TaxID=3346385 RepID=UPI0036D900E2
MKQSPPAPNRRPTRRWWLAAALVVLPVLLLAAIVGGLRWIDEADRHPAPDSGRPGAWVTTMTAAQVAEFAQVRIPASAADLRWGLQNGFQDDVAVLAFRLPQGEDASFTESLGVGRWDDGGAMDSTALAHFQHVGSPAPPASLPLREGEIKSWQPGHSKAVATTVWLAPGTDGFTQVWVYAMDVP